MGLSVLQQFKVKVASALGARDFALVEKLYFQYGNHLELVGTTRPQGTILMAVFVPHRPLFLIGA